jgi:uncharacterized protein
MTRPSSALRAPSPRSRGEGSADTVDPSALAPRSGERVALSEAKGRVRGAVINGSAAQSAVPSLGMTPCGTQTPLLAVLGNHEMYGDPRGAIAALRGSRIHLLVNEGVEFRSLWIAGISDYAAQQKDLRPDIPRALKSAPPGTLPILIAHQPKAFDEARARNIALTLVAHTHGGQLGIRPLGWSLAGLFLPYHMGLYQRGASQLFVNTGTGFWLVPFRLGMTGEITVIELHTAR